MDEVLAFGCLAALLWMALGAAVLAAREPRWNKSRWAAALAAVALAVPPLYLVGEGPVYHLAMRGWIPGSAYLTWITPIAHADPYLPEAIDQLRARWLTLWTIALGHSD